MKCTLTPNEPISHHSLDYGSTRILQADERQSPRRTSLINRTSLKHSTRPILRLLEPVQRIRHHIRRSSNYRNINSQTLRFTRWLHVATYTTSETQPSLHTIIWWHESSQAPHLSSEHASTRCGTFLRTDASTNKYDIAWRPVHFFNQVPFLNITRITAGTL